MSPEEADHVQHLEALVKRYRRRIVELKTVLRATEAGHVSIVGGVEAPGVSATFHQPATRRVSDDDF